MSTKLAASPARTYRSERRARQARETRERILAAASSEFEHRGYAATAMRVVARAAGVSVATVELGFGTKAELLRASIRFAIRGDGEPVAMLKRPWARKARGASSAPAFLAIVGSVLVEAEQRSAGLILAAFEAANHDESMSALADQLRSQRAETAAWIVDELMRRASLRDGITREQAIDTIWLLMDPHGFIALTKDRGWDAEQFEAWFIDSVRRLLLTGKTAPPTRASPSPSTPPTSKRRTS
jgi:AcrR family transcriptional regulator